MWTMDCKLTIIILHLTTYLTWLSALTLTHINQNYPIILYCNYAFNVVVMQTSLWGCKSPNYQTHECHRVGWTWIDALVILLSAMVFCNYKTVHYLWCVGTSADRSWGIKQSCATNMLINNVGWECSVMPLCYHVVIIIFSPPWV